MYDWQTKGCSKYGANMGRASDLPTDYAGEIQIRHVPIDVQGYDPGGAYWGTPNDLFCAFNDELETFYARAATPEAFKASVVEKFKLAKIVEPSVVSDDDIADMFTAYVEAALWSSNDNDEVPLDSNYCETDLAPETRERMLKDVKMFATECAEWLTLAMKERPSCDWTRAGHDLWLNRNGHGAGFWDGDWPEPFAKALDDAARKMRGVDLYVGDDGKIYC